jgi:HEAT repeat protein
VLAKTGGKKAIPHLIEAFGSKIRKRAMEQILRFGEDAAEPLRKALDSENKVVKSCALETLILLRDKAAYKLLVDDFEGNMERLSLRTANGLLAYGDRRGVDALLANDMDPGEAKYLLADKGDKRVLKHLIKDVLNTNIHNYTYMRAIKAIGELGDEKAIESLRALLLEDLSTACVNDYIARALIKLEDSSVFDLLIKALDMKSSHYYSYGGTNPAELLGEIDDKRAVPALIKQEMSECTVKALRKIGAPETADFFLSILEKGYRGIVTRTWLAYPSEYPGSSYLYEDAQECVWHAALALGELGDKRAVEPLKKLLECGDPWVSPAAAVALLRLGDSSVKDFIEKALSDNESMIQGAMIRALSESPHESTLPWLIKILGLESGPYCDPGSAIRALGRLGGKQALDALAAALKNEKYNYSIGLVLGELGNRRAIEPLIKVLEKGGSIWGGRDILKALPKLTGKDFGYNFQAWRRWWEEQEKQSEDK